MVSLNINIPRHFQLEPFPLYFACRGNVFRFIFPRFVLNLDLNAFMLFIYDMKSAFVSRVLPLLCLIMILFYKLSVKWVDLREGVDWCKHLLFMMKK